MSLTKKDLSDIRYVILDALDVAVNPRLDLLEEDVSSLKSDVSGLKSDVSSLKSDVSYLRNDMREVKDTLRNLDGRVEALEADIKEIYIMPIRSSKSSTTRQRI